jgi:hypothetical protein
MSDEIRCAEGITVSVGMAAYLVELIGLLEKLLARQNGCPLSAKSAGVRRDLEECIARAAAYADVSPEVVATQSVLPSETAVITTDAAADALGIGPAGVRWACRHGWLGRKVGGRWWITEEEIEMYRNTRRGVA